MKKFVSILLALALILALSTTAFAADTQITFSNETVERSYDGYQILKLTLSLKTGEHPEKCDGTNHVDACYNYAYKINETYFEILRAEAHEHAANTVWPNGVRPELEDVTEDQIIQYLSNQTGQTDNSYGTVHIVAERIFDEIKRLDMKPDKKNLSATVSVEQGYWIFVDTTALNGTYEANSMIIVDTAGQESLTIAPKTDIPRVEKKVKDIDDTELGQLMRKPWLDSADHDIGDAVPFKLTAILPSNVAYFDNYNITFHDTMSAGLTLNDTNSVNPDGPFAVLMYSSYNSAEGNLNMDNGTDVTNYFELEKNNTCGCSFEVASKQSILTIPGVTASSVFVVYYEATLNENAVHGGAGNPNEVYLEYTNDPHSDSTGKTTRDKVTVFTYKLIINKVDQDKKPLAGADFTLKKLNPNSKEYEVVNAARKAVNNNVEFIWSGLDDGEYMLEETTVPDGFNGMKSITFAISATHDELSNDPQLTYLDGDIDLGEGAVDTGIIEQDIINKTGTVLPSTGAEGTFFLITGGALLAVVAAVFMITRKKMSIYED